MSMNNTEFDVDEKMNLAQKIIGYEFKDKNLLRAALTHPSAVENMPDEHSYERLEFLGDSVVGFIVARELFERFPEMNEGKLTRLKVSLVSGSSFSAISNELGLSECIFFGGSEVGTGSRGLQSALENVYESIVGALLLDGGLEAAYAFVDKTLGPHLQKDRAFVPESPKSLLQECTQRDLHETPSYRLVSQSGPAHNPTFESEVIVGSKSMGSGIGSSKKEAEANAALSALYKLGYVDESGHEIFDLNEHKKG